MYRSMELYDQETENVPLKQSLCLSLSLFSVVAFAQVRRGDRF